MINFRDRIVALVIVLAIAVFISLSVAIPLSIKSKRQHDFKAHQLLENYPLIDGYSNFKKII